MKDEEIGIVVEMFNDEDKSMKFHLEADVFYLDKVENKLCYEVDMLPKEKKNFNICIEPKKDEFKGYGIDIFLYCNVKLIDTFSSSFDVVSSWRKATRYGFLSDFYQKDEDDEEDVLNISKLHINLVQFYDWMYRHHELVPSAPVFKDLMGRELSLNAVKGKIECCRRKGMKSIAYGAVYAASRDFYDDHKDWGLYDSGNKPLSLGELFFIMNISRECPWHNHIIEQYKNAVYKVGFDGIHMDTYGFPKTALSRLNNENKVEYLKYQFPLLINDTRRELQKIKDVCLIFNNVGNWPVHSVADAEQDALYIEVWKPYERYHHIKQIILEAKSLKMDKPVILAAYLKPFWDEGFEAFHRAQTSFMLLTAVIASNGGYYLILGEKNGILNQGYYVKYTRINDDCFIRKIRDYYDFIVRYSNLFFDYDMEDVSMTHVDGDNIEYVFENFKYSTYGEPDKVWVTVREKPGHKTVSFINLTGNCEDYWNSGKNKPEPVKDIKVRMQIDGEVEGVFFASPDFSMGRASNVNYHVEDGYRGKVLVIDIPEIDIWGVLSVELEDGGCFND